MDSKVLIITSDSAFSQELAGQLSPGGYAVDTAPSIQEGLMKMKLNKPGFVVVDMSSPNMDGTSFIQQMKQAASLADIPVLAVLGSGQEASADAVKQAGANDVLTRAEIQGGALLQKVQGQGSAGVQAEAATGSGSGKQVIMLVEDDPFLHKIMTEQLQENPNFEVISCVDAETALQNLQQKTPHLILLDLLLPGMNGFEFLEKIKNTEQWKNVPVVILSNFGQEEDIQRAKKLGAVEFLVKAHYVPEEIIAKITEVLKKLQSSGAGTPSS